MAAYRITTVTGQLKGSGTDARVYISLVGNGGKLTKVRLDNDKNNFETGRIDVFNLEAMDLGDLTSVTIQHDGTGIGSGWFLSYIFVSNENTKKRWMFPCNKWLDKHEDDGKTERTLTPGAAGSTIYQIKVKTGDVKDAGTDANISASIIGKKGKTESLKLKNSEHTNKFEQGQIDTFAMEGADVGAVTQVTIGHDNSGLGASWHCESVEVLELGAGTTYFFPCDQWFDKKKGDGLLERTLNVKGT